MPAREPSYVGAPLTSRRTAKFLKMWILAPHIDRHEDESRRL
jgi:hypothetical protein